MGERRVKMNPAQKFVGETLRQGMNDFAQCGGFEYADMTEFIKFREELKEKGTPISPTVLIAKAVGIAMQDFPELNSIVTGGNDKVRFDELIIYDEVNVAVGVAVGKDLMLVVLKDVYNRSLTELNDDFAALVERARNKKVRPEDMSGATITISNLMSGRGEGFSSAISGNQALMLGIGGLKKRAIVVNDEIVARDTVSVNININHTATQGLPASMFRSRLVDILENPREHFK